ncbi:hypothetical protein ACO1O0_001359 [Amphichorda felina]
MSPARSSRLAVLGWHALITTTRANIEPTRRLVVGRAAAVHTIPPKRNSSFAPRHGKGVEPAAADAEQAPSEKPPSKIPEEKNNTVKSVVKTEDQGTFEFAAAGVRHNRAKGGRGPAEPTAEAPQQQEQVIKEHGGPLDEVLHVEPPRPKARQLPHMSPPLYVHHFDSYSLVKELQDGGYSEAQAIEAMKGIRALLAQNLDVAQESLVSKSDVENETYLFNAACSELRQEIKNNRRLQDEQIRQQRTHLQHEVDILTQSLNQEVLTLNDNVRGMFNDRKMTVREEQKTADSAVQQINYKISTSLVSDSKSEIEGVRWILIRRSALGIFFMAMLTLGTVRYATYLLNERQKEADRKKEEAQTLRRDAGKKDHSSAADAAAILAAN